jgi:hypothetical protein
MKATILILTLSFLISNSLNAQKSLSFTNETCEKIGIPYSEGNMLQLTCEFEFENKSASVISLTQENYIKECSCSTIADVTNVRPGQRGKIIYTYTLDPSNENEYESKIKELQENQGLIEKEFGVRINDDEFYQLYFTGSVTFN